MFQQFGFVFAFLAAQSANERVACRSVLLFFLLFGFLSFGSARADSRGVLFVVATLFFCCIGHRGLGWFGFFWGWFGFLCWCCWTCLSLEFGGGLGPWGWSCFCGYLGSCLLCLLLALEFLCFVW